MNNEEELPTPARVAKRITYWKETGRKVACLLTETATELHGFDSPIQITFKDTSLYLEELITAYFNEI